MLALALVLAGYASGGPVAAQGCALGVVGVGVSLLGTWMGIVFMGRLVGKGSVRWQGAAVPVSVMVVKLPVVLLSMVWAQRLGPTAMTWFLVGLALVYCSAIGWAVSQH